MEKFCKLFESEKFGQILVMKDTRDDGAPAVFVKFIPQGMGVCGPDYAFNDDNEDDAWDKVDKLFDSITLESCEKIAAEVTMMTRGMIEDLEAD